MADISLSSELLELFVDMWEENRCLWDPADPNYKNKMARAGAMGSIADAFDRGWTIEEVKRKLESLKAYYRTQKNKKKEASTTGSAGGKKSWPFFERIHSFLGTVQYNSNTVTGSIEPSTQLTVDIPFSQLQAEDDNSGSVASSAGSDIDLLTRRTQLQRREQIVTESLYSQPGTAECMGDVTTPPLKRRVLGTGRKQITAPKADYQETVVSYIQDLKDSRKKLENPHMNYALTVAERLVQVKNAKRVTVLKHKIDNLLYEAIIEEMADDEINTNK